jgi:hypothetical protein
MTIAARLADFVRETTIRRAASAGFGLGARPQEAIRCGMGVSASRRESAQAAGMAGGGVTALARLLWRASPLKRLGTIWHTR